MEELTIKGAFGSTKVYLGANLESLVEYVPTSNVFILTDRDLYPRIKHRLPSFPTHCVYPGDYSKSMRNATTIYRWLQNHGADRDSFILGVGGGVVTDLAGFVAATYLRGVHLGLAPTTLLSQIDASIGGKNALNFDGFKNVIGTIYPPEFILCDYNVLDTLPKVEVRGGLSEMVKHAVIADAQAFEKIDRNADRLLALDREVLDPLIGWSIRLKQRYVEADEFDHNERRQLNFGHSWGHAVEAVTGMHHGLAVSIGMVFATRFAQYKGHCDMKTVERLENLLAKLGLPLETDVLKWVIFDVLQRDKKRVENAINFIFPTRIGEVIVEKVTFDELRDYIKE